MTMDTPRNWPLTVFYSEDDRPYIYLKDGSEKYFKTLFEAMEGLVEEYPLEEGDDLQ